MLGLRGLKSGVGHISSWPQDSSKIQKIGHFGAKNLPKPIANISVRFERKKIWPKKHFSKNPKISASEAPGPAKRGLPDFVLGPATPLVQFLSKSDLGRRECSVLLTCNDSFSLNKYTHIKEELYN